VQRLGTDFRVVGSSLDARITKAKADQWSEGTSTDWAKESFKQAKRVAYDLTGLQHFIDDRGVKGVRLDAAYENRALLIVQEQLSKAGIRLATVLNYALK
jgi:hypothetical protein